MLLALVLLSTLTGTAFAETLDDGSPWTDYVLRENIAAGEPGGRPVPLREL